MELTTDPGWYPFAPEMCGQCGSNRWVETSRNEDIDSVLIEFTCRWCGYTVNLYGHASLGASS